MESSIKLEQDNYYNQKLDGEPENLRFDTLDTTQSLNFKIDNKALTIQMNEIGSPECSFFNEKNQEVKEQQNITIKEENTNIESSKIFQDISLENKIKDNKPLDAIDYSKKKSSEKRNNKFEPYFEIQDGEQKTEMGLNFRFYRIVEILPNDEKIKSDRRYSHFTAFSKKLQITFPWIVVPELVEKNIGSKIMTVNDKFYIKRRKHLNFFLRYLGQHEEIKKTREYYKFITDPNFDDNYFNKETPFYSEKEFSESIKNHDTLANKFIDYFKKAFISTEDNEAHARNKNNNYVKFQIKYGFFKDIENNLQLIKKDLYKYYSNVETLGTSFIQLSDNLIYLKDVNFTEYNIKSELLGYQKISKELGLLNQKHLTELGYNLQDEIDAFLYILRGLCNSLKRYFDFIEFYNDILKKIKYNRINANSLEIESLNLEEKHLKEKRIYFEKMLKEEIENFIAKYDKKFSEIIKKFQELLKKLTEEEYDILNKIPS